MNFFSDINMFYLLLSIASLLFGCPALVAAKKDSPARGYTYGQPVPISCLSRSIESGEHIEDTTGNLQYIPFPTCNETSAPLSFRYGISETVSCTVDALTDDLYHLLEFYIHADVPLTCRMPTLPLIDSSGGTDRQTEFAVKTEQDNTGAASPFTPLPIALQGTLQKSHLHIWTGMNVLLHQIPSVDISQQQTQGKKRKANNKDRRSVSSGDIKRRRGQIIAGSAYSIPGVDGDDDDNTGSSAEGGSESKAPGSGSTLDPWAAGQGVKVIRGEPLKFTFRVAWVPGEDVLAIFEPAPKSVGAVFSTIFMFLMIGGLGGVVALWLDRRLGRRRGSGGWNGDGLLGSSPGGQITIGNPKAFGLGVRTNGYGGYSPSAGNGSSYGYGGYSSGKRD